jgi:hypothetical protein
MISKLVKSTLANFIVRPVLRVIDFAKFSVDFNKLDPHDQICLLNGGIMEIFICSSSSMYDAYSNKLINCVSKNDLNANASSTLQLDILRVIWSEDLFEKTINFMKSMSELRIDEPTLILMLPLILFAPDRRNLKDRHLIRSIQSSYSHLLKKYVYWKYGADQDSIQLFNRLLLVLLELRTLQELHSAFLMDVEPANMNYFDY